MPTLAANLTLLFADRPFLDRFAAAAAAGFRQVEFQLPYQYDAQEVKALVDENHLSVALHNLPAGDWAAGERGIACHPDRVDEFKEGVTRAIDYATTIGCRRINCLAGIRPSEVSEAEARRAFVENLRFAAPRLASAGIRLLIEPVNTKDVPGFFLSHTAQALEIIEAVAVDNLFLQFDVYHMETMEGGVADTIARHLPSIAHIQIADVPGRHEPGTGGIDFPRLLGEIDTLGYTGVVGCEYNPAGSTEEGLAWASSYLTSSRQG